MNWPIFWGTIGMGLVFYGACGAVYAAENHKKMRAPRLAFITGIVLIAYMVSNTA